MTAELGPTARALLEAARAELTPDAAAIARVRAKVGGAVAGGGGAAGLAGKLAMMVMVAAVSATTVYAVGSLAGVGSARGPAAPAAVVRAPSGAAAAAPPPGPTALVTEAARRAAPGAGAHGPGAPAPAAASRRVRDPALSEDPPPAVAPSCAAGRCGAPAARPRATAIATLGREVELIDAAMLALRRGDPRAALAAVRRHATETRGRGQLAEDAAAIEIEALCALRDPRAARKLVTFDARWPHSAQRARLSTSCP